MDRCEEIRKKYHESGGNEAELDQEVKKLAKSLPENWRSKITAFIKSGMLDLPDWGTQITMRDDFDKKSGWQRGLFVQIFKDTNLEDIRKIWNQVKNYQKQLPEIWAPGFSDEDLIILEAWKEVMAWPKKPRSVTAQVSAIVNDKHGINLDDSDIRKRLSEIRKQLAVQKPTKKNRQ